MRGAGIITRGFWIAVIAAGAVTIAANAQQPQAKPTEPIENVLKDAPKAYMDRCVYCHDTGVGPVLHGRGLNENYVGLVVRNGLRAMPAFRTVEVDDKQIAEVAAYLSKMQPGQKLAAGAVAGPANAEKGKALYQQSCVTCHGAQGKGDGIVGKSLVPPVKDFTSEESKKKSPAELQKIIEDGAPGTAMPSWKTVLSPQDIQDVLAHVLELRK